jgi:glutamate carboxypeptidase
MIPHDLMELFCSYGRLILGDVEELVRFESPSTDRMALETLKGLLIDRFLTLKATVQTASDAPEDGHIIAQFDGPAARRPALVLAHYDTVWPVGTIDKMPYRVENGRAYGPGIFDMKASLAIFLRVMELLQNAGIALTRPVWALFTADEELGSPSSRGLVESLARQSAYALVLEPALADGGLKTARKGVGRYQIKVEGRAAHAGAAPADGRSAIVELAHQILGLQRLADSSAGTTITTGLVHGGTAANVVPDRAWAEIDVRAASQAEAARVHAALVALRPITPDVRLTVTGSFNRPPLERTPDIAHLFEQARRIGEELRLKLTEGSTGGASDGNFTAAMGLPTLDGLGARGGGAHAIDEHIVIDSLSERSALLAALLLKLETYP